MNRTNFDKRLFSDFLREETDEYFNEKEKTRLQIILSGAGFIPCFKLSEEKLLISRYSSSYLKTIANPKEKKFKAKRNFKRYYNPNRGSMSAVFDEIDRKHFKNEIVINSDDENEVIVVSSDAETEILSSQATSDEELTQLLEEADEFNQIRNEQVLKCREFTIPVKRLTLQQIDDAAQNRFEASPPPIDKEVSDAHFKRYDLRKRK